MGLAKLPKSISSHIHINLSGNCEICNLCITMAGSFGALSVFALASYPYQLWGPANREYFGQVGSNNYYKMV